MQSEGRFDRTRADRSRLALAAVLGSGLLFYAWNAVRVPPLTGFDEDQHAAYILTLVRDGRLPHPMEGWSTFHPPLYYLVASGFWRPAEPLGPPALHLALRSLGVAAAGLSAAAAFALVRRTGADVRTAAVATLLVLFVPCRQLAAMMIGNEATASAVIAAALVAIAALQRNPDRVTYALGAGALTGLALATKFTAVALLPACAVPFLGGRAGGRAMRCALFCGLAIAVVAGPVYVRNLALTGTAVPMTREREPMRSLEEHFLIRPREVADYLRIPRGVFENPSVHARAPDATGRGLNHDMQSVWGLVYAGVWYDPFGVRVPRELCSDESLCLGTLLLILGMIPTLVTLAGLAAATRAALSTRLRDPDAPLAVFTWVVLALFVRFTWIAPALVAAKAAYLLPAAVPCAVFFARGASGLGRRLRPAVLAASLLAAVVCAVSFAEGAVFDSRRARFERVWVTVARALPTTPVLEALAALGAPGVSGQPGTSATPTPDAPRAQTR